MFSTRLMQVGPQHRRGAPRHALSVLIAVGLLTVSAGIAYAQDWSSCADDLDTLRRRSDDASTAAQDANSAKSQLDRARDEFENCRRYPAVYDLFKDGCSNQRSTAESALSAYKSAVGDLESKLDDVDSKVRSVSSSCSSRLSSVLGPPLVVPSGVSNQSLCRSLLRFKGRMEKTSLIELCSKYMPADQCSLCLTSK